MMLVYKRKKILKRRNFRNKISYIPSTLWVSDLHGEKKI